MQLYQVQPEALSLESDQHFYLGTREAYVKEYLVYWKYYWGDTGCDAPGQFRWACANKRFYNAIKPGDALWVVVQGGPDHPGEWRLLERTVVSQKSIDPEGDVGYGRFAFEGDSDASERFRPDELPDFTPVLQSLQFFTGKHIELEGSRIGQALQTPRRLADGDPERIRHYLAGVASHV